MNTLRNSPHFSQLVSWLKEENLQELSQFFPLKDMNTWIRRKYRSKFYSKVDLVKLRNEVCLELIDPLFIKPAINIKYEDNPREHRRDNLFCCFEVLIRDLKRIKKRGEYSKFENVTRRFHADFERIAPTAIKPFSWTLESQGPDPKEEPMYSLRREWERLKEKLNKIDQARDRFFEKYMDLISTDTIQVQDSKLKLVHQTEYMWKKTNSETEAIETKIYHKEKKESSIEQKLDLAMKISKRILNWLKIARGKPGCHPKPFNVLVYHLINKCTHWKFDENHRHVYHENGQHKLKKDWKLILFLILDTHLNVVGLSELRKFISDNKKTSAHDALKILKERLNDRYKNFHRLEGWSFPRKIDETGFRKLIAHDDGTLHIVRL